MMDGPQGSCRGKADIPLRSSQGNGQEAVPFPPDLATDIGC